MPVEVAVTAVAAVCVAVVASAVLPALLWVRWSLRRVSTSQRECDQWREAAANATVAARVQAADSDDDEDTDWNAG